MVCGARGAYDGVRQRGGDGGGDGELLQGNRSLSPHTDSSLDYTNRLDTMALEVRFACTEVAHQCW